MKKGFIKRTKSKAHNPDKQLIITIFILIFLGLILLVSASSEVSRINTGNPYYYFFRQLLYGVGIGLILFFITQKVHYSFWRKQAVFILMFCIFLLALVFVPQIGISHGGSKRWINLGFASFQPSELVKLGFIISTISFLLSFVILIKALVTDYIVPGWASTMMSLWFLGGLIIMVLGIVGIYVGKTFNQTKDRPIYIIKDSV